MAYFNRIFLICLVFVFVESTQKRCYQCESRGHLGSCNDPFLFSNISETETPPGVQVSIVHCPSGWCGKVIDKREDDIIIENEYDTSTKRFCISYSPNDNEARCQFSKNLRGVSYFLCICQGDLCNRSSRFSAYLMHVVSLIFLSIFIFS